MGNWFKQSLTNGAAWYTLEQEDRMLDVGIELLPITVWSA
jgi:hypothetical protein